ncbi:MAG TPA: 2-oxoacid:acceptor oxidoreductase family protein [Thermotogota bacterium]|nr:2-oxoacid:acceptor oxidoreductase family protein [Thermotogota bacterium]HPJ87983.1 2-oxoacid:acceptor oxidoreductase family protein [Thermotogota bacterium]HPR95070.1 2-oxoacid:acceptor oxidoreductase family protein [Thermotogota bacterium]
MSLHGTIVSGFGGQGVMLIGQIISYAAMEENMNVTWLPSYGPEMRGGTAYCMIVMDEESVGSPIVDKPTEVIAMNIPSLLRFEGELAENGVMVLNTSVVDREPSRKDIRVVKVDANKVADEIGNSKVANMVVLGSYVAAAGIVSIDSVKAALEKKLTGKKAKLVDINIEAVKRGMQIAQEQL